MSQNTRKNSKTIVLAIVLGIAILTIPAFAFSSHKHKIYVDDSASGDGNGSVNHPYRTINEALDHADNNTEIHVAKGEYKENITLKKGVKLFGAGEDKTTIKGRHDDRAVVTMKDNTRISDVMVKEGRDGIRVEDSAEVSIINSEIRDNDKDGIFIESGSVRESERVTISGCEIKNNDKAGIFSRKRRLVIVDNEVQNNDSDGVLILAGASAWISGNTVSGNGGSGMNLTVDGSSIWTKHNQLRENSHDGLEVHYFGGWGRINVEMSKLVNNGRYGIERIQCSGNQANTSAWDQSLTLGTQTELWGNNSGTVSGIMLVR